MIQLQLVRRLVLYLSQLQKTSARNLDWTLSFSIYFFFEFPHRISVVKLALELSVHDFRHSYGEQFEREVHDNDLNMLSPDIYNFLPITDFE